MDGDHAPQNGIGLAQARTALVTIFSYALREVERRYPRVEQPRSPALPSTLEALRPAIAAADADGHLVSAILLPHALGVQHLDTMDPAYHAAERAAEAERCTRRAAEERLAQAEGTLRGALAIAGSDQLKVGVSIGRPCME